jgi:CHAT domain
MSTESMKSLLAAGRGAAPPAVATPTTEHGLTRDPALITAFAEELGPDDADLSRGLAPNMAMMIVTPTTFENSPAFQLYFHYRGVAQSATTQAQLARQRQDLSISLAHLTVQGRQDPPPDHWRRTYGRVRNWWSGMSPLSRWMGDLVDAGDDSALIIWDETDYEIPWELFYRDPRTYAGTCLGREGWLGALIPVIRWTSAPSTAPPWQYTAVARQCDGPLLIAEGVTTGHAEADPFDGLPVLARFSGLLDMLVDLGKDDLGTFGLAIVHGHGDYATNAGEFTLDGVPLNELDEYPMGALTKCGALVLLNVCASGRPSASNRPVPHSFVEVFLRSGAGGVIATSADVDLNQRHDFVIRFVNGALGADLSIAEALRSLRAGQADKARKILAKRILADQERRKPLTKRTMTDETLEALDKQIENVYKWFFAEFAYLYYGHVSTRLRVRVPRQP